MAGQAELRDAIAAFATRFRQQFDSNGWNRSVSMVQVFGAFAPPVSADILIQRLDWMAEKIGMATDATIQKLNIQLIIDTLPAQIAQMQVSSFNQNNGSQAVAVTSFVSFLEGLVSQINSTLEKPKVDWIDLKDEKDLIPKDLARRLRSVSSRIEELEPRSQTLNQKITEIEAARDAAEQLPTDLADLAEKRSLIAQLSTDASGFFSKMERNKEEGQEVLTKLKEKLETSELFVNEFNQKISDTIKKSEQALRGSTSVGLAHAFETRRAALAKSMSMWTFGLVGALITALVVGYVRVEALKSVLDGTKSNSVVWANVLITLLGVGSPVWFAWLSTRQIGVSFRLQEDYAFKASIAQAYEGYRAEALEIDSDMNKRLFSSALDRLEEAPIRLMDHKDHHSPVSEFMDSEAAKTGLAAIGGLVTKATGANRVSSRNKNSTLTTDDDAKLGDE